MIGKGDGTHSYSFTEADQLAANAYYRIKQIDMDEGYTYSPVIRLRPADAVADRIAVYPVPFTTGFTVNSSKMQKANLVNTRGQILQQIRLSQGSTYVNAAEFRSGVYYLTTENGHVQKLVKQ